MVLLSPCELIATSKPPRHWVLCLFALWILPCRNTFTVVFIQTYCLHRSVKSRCMSLGQNQQATPFKQVRLRTGIILRMRDWGVARLLLQRRQGSVILLWIFNKPELDFINISKSFFLWYWVLRLSIHIPHKCSIIIKLCLWCVSYIIVHSGLLVYQKCNRKISP